ASAMESEVWGSDCGFISDHLAGRLATAPDRLAIYTAEAAGQVVAAAWVMLQEDGQVASPLRRIDAGSMEGTRYLPGAGGRPGTPGSRARLQVPACGRLSRQPPDLAAPRLHRRDHHHALRLVALCLNHSRSAPAAACSAHRRQGDIQACGLS